MYRELAETFLKAAERKTKSSGVSAVLKDPAASMLELYAAIRQELPAEFFVWEPETLWHSLPDLNLANRDKVMAAIAITTQPSFFSDYRIFGHTCEIAAHDEPMLGHVPRPSVEGMVWGVIEAEILYSLDATDSPEFSPEVESFMVGVLATNGFVVAPKLLSFVEGSLEDLSSELGKSVAAKIKDHLKSASADTLTQEAVKVQQMRLEELDLYLEERSKTALAGLKSLTF